jgi:hypothetical protein
LARTSARRLGRREGILGSELEMLETPASSD